MIPQKYEEPNKPESPKPSQPEEEKIRKMPRIGRGKKMSIAKAALVWWFTVNEKKSLPPEMSSIDYGTYGILHEIIDIAGAKQCSFLTPRQVIACLRSSPFWDCVGCPGFYAGIGNGKASLCKPSMRGRSYYLTFLKHD